jgi:hypothetical protein
VPVTELKTIPITWHFAVWGLDMVGPFKTVASGYTHILVAVDKFTKLVEARPIASLSGETATRFIKDIVVRMVFCIVLLLTVEVTGRKDNLSNTIVTWESG